METLVAHVVHDSRIVEIGSRDEIVRAVAGRAGGRDVMLLIYIAVEHGIHPVSIRIGHVVRISGVGDSVRVPGLLPPEIYHRLRENRGVAYVLG